MTDHIDPGFYRKSHQDYHSGPGLSQSMIKALLRSPAHARVPVEETPALRFGRAAHTGILEPHLFEKEYTILPADCQVGSGKGQRERKAEFEADAAQKGQAIITKDDTDRIFAMSEAVWSYSPAAELLRAGERELSIYWQDPIYPEILCKGRIDWLNKESGLLLDVKTTDDARTESFTRTANNLGYDIQAAFYLYGTSQITKVIHDKFYFIVIEKDPPHGVIVYRAEEEFIDEGLKQIQKGIAIYDECLKNNYWPAYPPEVKPLTLPPWKRRKGQNAIFD